MATTTDDAGKRPLWRRLSWFAAIWIGSVAALGAVAAVIKMAIGPS